MPFLYGRADETELENFLLLMPLPIAELSRSFPEPLFEESFIRLFRHLDLFNSPKAQRALYFVPSMISKD